MITSGSVHMLVGSRKVIRHTCCFVQNVRVSMILDDHHQPGYVTIVGTRPKYGENYRVELGHHRQYNIGVANVPHGTHVTFDHRDTGSIHAFFLWGEQAIGDEFANMLFTWAQVH